MEKTRCVSNGGNEPSNDEAISRQVVGLPTQSSSFPIRCLGALLKKAYLTHLASDRVVDIFTVDTFNTLFIHPKLMIRNY